MIHRLGFLGGLGLALLTSAFVAAQESTARLATFEKANGETYFALSLPPVATKEVKPAEVVLLIDTSASQNGKFRDDSFLALREMLATLPAGTKVKLMAVDVRAVALTEGFVDSKGEKLNQGLAQLSKRLPLGATDLPTGLRVAVESFDPATTVSKNVVYFGDGMSKANFVNSQKIQDLVGKAVAQQVAISSYAIGAERNAGLLAAIANQTGGNLIVDSNNPDAPRQAGQFLAGTMLGQVVWPTSTSMPTAFAESFPSSLPPLRNDRDTVMIGRLKNKGQFKIGVNGDANGKPVSLNWSVQTEASQEDFSFLPQLVEVARPDGGASLPTLGSAGLREAALVTQESADNLSRLGQEALSAGNVEGAMQVANAILARDPKNPAGIALKKAAGAPQAKAIPVSAEPAEGGLRLVRAQQPIGNEAQPNPFGEPSGGLLASEEELKRVMEEKVKSEVESLITKVRSQLGDNPGGAVQSLKLALEGVERSTDLSATVRMNLRGQIQSVIREAERRSETVDSDAAERAAQLAIAQEMKRINESLDRKNIKLKQIMDRFNSLMAEGKYREATDDVAPEVTALAPNTPIESVAKWSGRMQRSYHELAQVWDQRERGFQEVMMLIEKSQIPFPDEPPVVYMEAEKWLDLTLRREKYKSVSLAKTGSAESRILDALKQSTQCEFIETPLKDVVTYFADLHQITIVLNQKDLDEVGVNSDTPITKTLKGISLRSALRLILNDHGLTYMIRDEVLQITNPDAASKPENLIRKVYPVGDLVVPINLNTNLFGLGGSGLGGSGLGGLGGQVGGGFGGGQFGGQGGGGGGGPFGNGGFGGGAAFDVNDSLSLGTKKPASQPAEAKPEVKAEAKPATIAPALAPKAAPRISVKVATGGSLAEAWDRYFAEQKQELAGQTKPEVVANKFAAIRQTVRELADAKKFDEVVAILQGAIRHGQVESWMYEALTLALDATNAPAEEIERTLMSAVDYAMHEEQLMLIAAYMVRLGRDQQGLALYRQAAETNPARPEAFIRGLDIAQRLNDLEGIKWSSLGLISQAWPREQKQLGEQAFRAAKAAYVELLRQGKDKEAREFELAALAAASRDVIVEVIWTGDADIDVQVNEPAGTFCSYRQQRSTSGGVFSGDSYAVGNRPMGGAYSEVYVCPQGFAGEYSVYLKNVWGKVAGGKVTVNIYTNNMTDKGQKIHHQIPMSEKDAVVVFELKEGRRKEALPEAQVANVAKAQNAVDRAVLAQQLAALDQSSIARSVAMERARLQGMGIDPNFFRRTGAVGYRPIIVTLPEGANFSTNAVISADRRYVRVSPSPTFSQVTDVVTYNTSTGATTNTTNQFGGGGNGFFGAQGGGGMGVGIR